MSSDGTQGIGYRDAPALTTRSTTKERGRWPSGALPFLAVFTVVVLFAQSAIVVQARPQDLVTGVAGMWDILRRSMPPDISLFGHELLPALETVDIGIFGTPTNHATNSPSVA